MTYPDSVRFLYSLGNEVKTAKLGLDRIRTLLAEIGSPQEELAIVHVAGTNGKGSTAAMIEAGLRYAGLRTGLFTSPHLLEPTERIQIDGVPVSSALFVDAFEEVHHSAERLIARGDLELHPTYFETVTAMALLIFERCGAELTVLEVGLGGRLDATNVVTPRLAVITPVDFDHEALLGRSLEAIAAEKAGILKPGVPAVFAEQRPEAAAVIESKATALGILARRTREWNIRNLRLTARGSSFDVGRLHIECPLAGEHQVENALAAAMALETLNFPVEGIALTRWPGRLERIAESPEIVVDGAHNPAGARALARYIDRFYIGRRVWLIYGAMRDKAVAEIGGILFPRAWRVIFTAPAQSRAAQPETLRALSDSPSAEICASVAEAIDLFRRRASDDDVAFITGSLFLVGEALRHVA